ncbi:MAG: serpin family protein [Prevotella sp.]|nr:serpin family protein [Prevotella sp.]
MRKAMLWVAVALMMTAVSASCGSSDEEPSCPKPVVCPVDSVPVDQSYTCLDLTRGQRQLVTSSNGFAFRLFRQLLQKGNAGPSFEPERSIIVSPISITYALGMLNNGAAGETQQQINQTLGFGDAGADGVNTFCRKMLTEAPRLDELTQVLIANTIFMNKDYELRPEFVALANAYYDATPETRDFSDGLTRQVINQWASDHTKGMIPMVLGEAEFEPKAVSYLLNAIYFKGAWTYKFDTDATFDEPFYANGSQTTVPMMHQNSKLGYTDNDVCQVLQLPYGNGAYNMTIMLPHDGKDILDVLSMLSADSWPEYRDLPPTETVNVALPRFETNSDINLKQTMSDLGMPLAFWENMAEFPNFCNVPTHIGMMKQVARIKLNEEGTEAAAVTVIGIYDNSAADGPRSIDFIANRPFLYIISERSTGAIFFIGQYAGD